MPSVPVCASLAELEDYLQNGIDPVSSPGIAYGISKRGDTILLGAAGYADKERQILATSRTPFSLASVTKPMCATALAMLADQGLVDLDAPINQYFRDTNIESMVGDWEEATIRQVANHTAGLPLHYQFFYEDEPYTPPAMPETIRRYGKLYNPPGERYHYSNIGFGILDYLIEVVTRKPFAVFMAEQVFGSLGMVHSSIGAVGGEAISYGFDGVGYPRYGFDHPGASAAFSSVEDLLQFGQSHLGFGPQLLSPEARLEMQTPTAFHSGTFGYGFGWSTNSDLHGLKTVGHAGGMSGVNTILLTVPEEQIVVVILVNGQSALPFRGADNALGVLFPGFREKLRLTREYPPEPEDGSANALPGEIQRFWDGNVLTYAGEVPIQVDFSDPGIATANWCGQVFEIGDIAFRDGRVIATFDGQIPTPDAYRRPHTIRLDLKLRRDILSGAAVAITSFEGEGSGARGNRRGNAVSHWVEMG